MTGDPIVDVRDLRESLFVLARNHRWTWSTDVRALLASLPRSSSSRHPVEVVAGLDEAQLTALLDDGGFVERVQAELAVLDGLTATRPATPDIAYFSPEFGISDLVPQYSGGLGVLAGDHLKAASDLGVALCGVGLFYREGFFRQSLERGRQRERYEHHAPEDLGGVDTGATVEVPVADHDVTARVWRFDVGRVPLLLLDTDVDANSSADRAITDRLYSGDRRHRLEQELVLGVGGSRALRALGWGPAVHHLNEGHAGFLVLDLVDAHIESGASLEEALAAVRPGLVFTTHTPVPAGIDRFDHSLAGPYLQYWAGRWDVSLTTLLAMGAGPADERPAFNMAALCLRAAGRACGVSRLHGEVSRHLFSGLPGGDTIGSVTNGVHARTWVAPRLQDAFDRVLGDGWAEGKAEAWDRIDGLDDETIRTLSRSGADDLRALVAERTDAQIEPEALTVGFARRFATYKRATLLLQHPELLTALLADEDRPVQFVFAGKAHPADTEGKALLAEIVAFGRSPQARGRFVFVPDYDMAVARAMYAGTDVWLNNPVRPHEASGTSGEKAALNGGLNCSISDGWWDEMADERNGWTIPASDASDPSQRDRVESAAALALLSGAIAPEFFADGTPWSAAWIARMRDAWRSLGPRVTAARMVDDYVTSLYQPALDDVRAR